jgi:UDP-N-acetylglucosamine 2-epimerase
MLYIVLPAYNEEKTLPAPLESIKENMEKAAYRNMLVSKNPYGEGKASEYIISIIRKSIL